MPEIYLTDKDNTARFVMGAYEKNPLIAIGLNPSRATPEKLDVTVSKVKKFALLQGFDGYIMLNLYPQRATLPEMIDHVPNPVWMKRNLNVILEILSLVPESQIWACWGNLIDSRAYMHKILLQIRQDCAADIPWMRLGSLTKKGHPRHPSRLGYATPFYSFEVATYCNSLLLK